MDFQLIEPQENAFRVVQNEPVFLAGPPGCGKTTVGLSYLHHLVNSGIHAENILVLVPQRTLAAPYYSLMQSVDLPAGNISNIATIGGVARRMIQLFWPLISETPFFNSTHLIPKFLTLETAQYHAAKIIEPLIDNGLFDSVTIDRNRIYSQILDNLNKTSLIGIPHTVIGEKLKSAWVGKPEQIRIYDEVQECATLFRQYCLENCLLDYSLQMEIFANILWQNDDFRKYFFNKYQYLIFDNIEEDAPITHDIVREWLPGLKNYLLIYDTNGGYRVFLGADPISGFEFSQLPLETHYLDQSFILSENLAHLNKNLARKIRRESTNPNKSILNACLTLIAQDYYPELIHETCQVISDLVFNKQVRPSEICVLAPYLSDSLRFAFDNRLQQFGIPLITNRPSRSLKDEPAAQCILTFLKLLNPDWEFRPTKHEFRQMLMQSIEGLDLVRADLLAKIIYRPGDKINPINSFDMIHPTMQDRITHTIGERFELLKDWIIDNKTTGSIPLDIMTSKLFGEVLSQPGYGFHNNFNSAEITTRLIESMQKFHLSGANNDLGFEDISPGKEYIEMLSKGVIAALHVENDEDSTREAVYLAPAYTFLMQNKAVRFQFWLDIGSQGWWERLNQPLTHPYILSRQWPDGQKWTDSFEYDFNQQALLRLVSGLISRCKENIYLCQSRHNEQGNDQQGPLLKAFNLLFREAAKQEGKSV